MKQAGNTYGEDTQGKLDFTGFGNFQFATPEEYALKSAEKRLAVAEAVYRNQRRGAMTIA